MTVSNTEALEGLTKQQQELESAINKLSAQLESAKTQYLKVSGAVDVLTQIEESAAAAEEGTAEEV
tara:strand:+ start:1824 stop:2021 length:198 start_codon:yes stop_codon:yes gene_type:complete